MSFIVQFDNGCLLDLLSQCTNPQADNNYQISATANPITFGGPPFNSLAGYDFDLSGITAQVYGPLINSAHSDPNGNWVTFAQITAFDCHLKLFEEAGWSAQNIAEFSAPTAFFLQSQFNIAGNQNKLQLSTGPAVACYPTPPTRPIDGLPMLSYPNTYPVAMLIMVKDNGGIDDQYVPFQWKWVSSLVWDDLMTAFGGLAITDVPFVMTNTVVIS